MVHSLDQAAENLIPESKQRRGLYIADVVENRRLCREHYRLDLHLETFPSTEPGQFIQLGCRDISDNGTDRLTEDGCEHEWADGRWPGVADSDLVGPQAMLRRPFSLAGRADRKDGVVLSIIHRVVGVGTNWLSTLHGGDSVDLIGPLGNHFPKPTSGYAVLVGGGVGIPPMLYLANRWRLPRLIAFCGATTRDLMPLTIMQSERGSTSAGAAEFAGCNTLSVISTDDGTAGFHGLITTALEKFLDRPAEILPAASLPADFALDLRPVLYTCGPEGMMKRVATIARERGLQCFVAVERAMACGMGTCQSCVIRSRPSEADHASEWKYTLSCAHGPIFAADQLLW